MNPELVKNMKYTREKTGRDTEPVRSDGDGTV